MSCSRTTAGPSDRVQRNSGTRDRDAPLEAALRGAHSQLPLGDGVFPAHDADGN
jgi:hypothetical protein